MEQARPQSHTQQQSQHQPQPQQQRQILLPCPQHPYRYIERVNPNLSIPKRLYCVDCMFESEDPKGLYKALPSLPTFIETSSASFDKLRTEIKPTEQPPQEYLQVLGEQQQEFEKMRQHIKIQKDQIQEFFEYLLNEMIEYVDKERLNYMKLLDDQLQQFIDKHMEFQKGVQKSYPRREDIISFFPTRQEIENRFFQVKAPPELETVIKDLQENLHNSNSDMFTLSNQSEEQKRTHLNGLVKMLKDIQYNLPLVEIEDLVQDLLKEDFKPWLNLMLKEIILLKNPIVVAGVNPEPVHRALTPAKRNNSILSNVDIKQVADWLPKEFVFDGKDLLYRGSVDGFIPRVFHEKCDDKGPTISFIKCQFEEATKQSIIGGFIDSAWHMNNTWIASEKAFIFSLTAKVKCPIMNKAFGALANAFTGPCFGNTDIYTHSINTNAPFNESYVYPKSFATSNKLIESPKYKGIGKFHFSVIEIEVYAVKELLTPRVDA